MDEMPSPTDVAGMRVAALVSDNFEQVELTGPRQALEAAGAKVTLVSTHEGSVQGMRHDIKADVFPVELMMAGAQADQFDAVLLPGGVMNGDELRLSEAARRFVTAMQVSGKPMFVICHGAWLLVSAGLVAGRTLTSWPSLKDDIHNAGGSWIDTEVAVDGKLVSSRKPDDLPAFNAAMLKVLAQSRMVVRPQSQSDG